MNNAKTVGLLAVLTALLFWVTFTLFDGVRYGPGLAIGVAVLFNLAAYFFSDKIALAATRARPVTEEEMPQFYAIMRRLTTSIPETALMTTTTVSTAARQAMAWPIRSGEPGVSMRLMRLPRWSMWRMDG